METESTTAIPPEHASDLEKSIQDGLLTREEVNESLRAGGMSPLSAPVAESKNFAAAEIDKLFPPAKPEEFRIPSIVGGDGRFTEEMAKDIGQYRDWLASARLTKETGNAIASEVHNVSTRLEKMNPAEREDWVRKQEGIIQKVFKGNTERMLDLAVQLVDEIEAKNPGFKDFLERTGAGDSATVVVQLAMHAETLYDRNGGK